MVRAALYIRVSTNDQSEYSIDAQKRLLLEYAKKNKYVIEQDLIFIEDGVSGTSAKKRPVFQKMITQAKKKTFDVILVHKFDRFARSREDSILYKALLQRDCNIKVISITEHIEDGRVGLILESMLEGMAEYYSLNLADEVKKGIREKALLGKSHGKTPFGYGVDSETQKLVINKEEAEVVKLIFEKVAQNELSYRGIAMHLQELGITNRNGHP